MPRAVVTGGAGFIGSHMVDLLLDRGYRGARRRQSCRWPQVEPRPSQGQPQPHLSLGRHPPSAAVDAVFERCDYVFHFAGIGDIVPSIEAPSEYMDTNVQGTVRVLECARHANVRKFVYAASSSCYGLAGTPTREDHPIDPQYPIRAVEIPRRTGGLSLAQSVSASRQFNLHLQRLRHPRADDGCLRRGLWRVFEAETGWKTVHGRW